MEQNKYISKTQSSVHEYLIYDKIQKKKKENNWLFEREYKENFSGGTRTGICLPMQGTQVCSGLGEDPTCSGANKPTHVDLSASTIEPTCRSYWSLQAPEPALHNKKPPKWEARTSHKEEPSLPQLEKARAKQQRPRTAKSKTNTSKIFLKKKKSIRKTYYMEENKTKILHQIRSVAQSCPTFCDPMNHSTPGLPVHHIKRENLDRFMKKRQQMEYNLQKHWITKLETWN